MSTNPQNKKLVTKQVRLAIDMHRELKLQAFKEGLKMSEFLYRIVNNYFEDKKYENRRRDN